MFTVVGHPAKCVPCTLLFHPHHTLQRIIVPILKKRKTEAQRGGKVQRGTLRRTGVPSWLSPSQQLQQTRTEPRLKTPPVSPIIQLFFFQKLGELENYKAPKSNPIKIKKKNNTHNQLHKSAERNLFSESVKRLTCYKWSWPIFPSPVCWQTGPKPQEGAGSAFLHFPTS